MKTFMKIGALGCVLAIGVAGTAVAQDGQQSADPDRMLAEFEERNGNGILDEDIENLTPDQMVERGESKMGAMQVTLEGTSALLEKARSEERDILKINCINENLASIKGFVNVGEQSYESLMESSSSSDAEAVRHHYTLVSIAGQRVTALGEQARVCAGEELRYADDAALEVSVDPDIGSPDEDVLGDQEVLDRPPKVTPYR